MTNPISNKAIDKILIGLLKQLQPGNKFYPSRASEMMELDQAHQAIATLLVKARIDEQQRTFIGCSEPTIEIWFEKDGNGHPSITKDDRIAELEAQLTPKEKSGE